jgi:hypothetical protein
VIVPFAATARLRRDGVRRREDHRWWWSKPFLIIFLAGIVHLLRGAKVDGFVFLGTAAALAVAEVRAPVGHTGRLPLGVALAAVPLGWVITTLRPATVPIASRWRSSHRRCSTSRSPRPDDPDPANLRPRWWLWATVGALICVWELSQFLQQPGPQTDSWDHPTPSVILGPLFIGGPGRTLLVIVWLAAGVWLARLMLGSRRCTR